MADQPATRADLYRVAAFLRELDRMMHPATTRPAGGYRLPPAILPPLPPTGTPGSGRPGAGSGASGWMTTRAAPPPPAPIPPDIAWVEPLGVPDTPPPPALAPAGRVPVPATTPGAVRSGTAGGVAESPARSAPPATDGPVRAPTPPRPEAPVVGPAPDPTPARQMSQATPEMAPSAAAVPPPIKASPPPVTGPRPAPVTDSTAGRHSGRPPLPMLHADERRVAELVGSPESAPGRAPRPPRLPPVSESARRRAAPGHRAPEGGAPSAAPPLAPPVPPEPVDLVVEGVDPAPTPQPSESDGTTSVPPVDDPFDTAVPEMPGPPPLPAARGPRRTLAHLPATTADRVQAELQRLYLDRTLRRSR